MWSRHRNFSPSLPVEGSFCKISISKTIRGSKSRAAYTSSWSAAVATGPETLPLVMVPLVLVFRHLVCACSSSLELRINLDPRALLLTEGEKSSGEP